MSLSLASTIRSANAVLIAEGNLAAVGDFFTSDYVMHLTGRDVEGGHDTVRKFLKLVRSAFPDLQVEVECLVESHDRIAWQRTLRGTHQGAFLGFPATGRPMVWREMLTSQFRDGLITEEWMVSDLAEHLLLARKR